VLPPGTKLGPYEIVTPIGSGGMGEVYRAHDSRLGRDVAIKVSAEQFSDRFEREARAIAALNHPHICTLHDVGPDYLVMELVEGPTLADRIRQGPIPLDDTLRIATQIAAALDAAHARGIVHRDLKPANVKLTPDGVVKVLDFGLAKQPDPSPPVSDPEQSPTINAPTRAGLIVGTAAYMAPEQARGVAVDKRVDIWAFGVVVYEMVTGARLFQGDTATDTIAAMLTTEPAWERVPEAVRPLLRRCLVKDPKQRLRDIGDIDLLMPGRVAAMRASDGRRWVSWSVAAAAVVAASAIALVHLSEQSAPARSVRFQFASTAPLAASGNMALSPDGRQLAFLATGVDGALRLFVRSMDSLEVRAVAGSETAPYGPPFFWSPDSQYLAYDGGGVLKRISVAGGLAQSVCDVQTPAIGGSWNRSGDIIFGNLAGGILRVPDRGGVAAPITVLDPARKEDSHLFPIFLPDDRHFLYYRVSRTTPADSGIYIGSLDVKADRQERRRLLPYSPGLTYAPPRAGDIGHVLFVREGTLIAQPFDERRLELAGDALPVAEHVGVFLDGAFVSASRNGVLAFRQGDPMFAVTWYDRRGNVVGRVSEPGRYGSLSLSPDGSRVIASLTDPRDSAHSDLWLLDAAAGGRASRFTFEAGARADFPIWSPDGRHIAFRGGAVGRSALRSKPLDGGSDDRIIVAESTNNFVTPTSWSPDGRFLLYASPASPATGWDVSILRLENGRPTGEAPIAFANSRFDEFDGRFSPDGRWVAYTSNESGAHEIYVRAFSSTAAPSTATHSSMLVSRGGGSSPRWRRDGTELFYLAPDDKIMVAQVSAGPEFRASPATPLFQAPAGTVLGDVAGDGQRFLLLQTGTSPFTVITNWDGAGRPAAR
jgi:eukaryotic-like serine/threonine-protein kinase